MEVNLKRVGLREWQEYEVKIKIDGAEISEELKRNEIIELACGMINDVLSTVDDEKTILPDIIKEQFQYAYDEIVSNAEENS